MKKRLDLLILEKGLVPSREKGQRLIMAGLVSVDGRIVDKAGTLIAEDADIAIKETAQYVGRGAEKIAGAARDFGLDFHGKVVADIGSSTGGFTDYALQNGAKKSYAIDVGTGQLDWRLRNDNRVVVMEQTHIRDVQSLPEAIDMFLVDVSFISLKKVLPFLKRIMNYESRVMNREENLHNSKLITHNSSIIALYKPQFEAGRDIADRHKGVIVDEKIHERLLADFREWCGVNDFEILGETTSPLVGDKGNREYFFKLVAEKIIRK